MTVKECIKQNGIQMETDELGKYQTVDVGFINADGLEDEVQFDIGFIGTKAGAEELEILFSDFCRENGFPKNKVTSVTVVKSADTYEELTGEDREEDIEI